MVTREIKKTEIISKLFQNNVIPHRTTVGLAIFMSYFLAFVFILLLSDFNMFDVLYGMLVALVALCHL